MEKDIDIVTEFLNQFGRVQHDPIIYDDSDGDTIAIDAEDFLRKFCNFLEQRLDSRDIFFIIDYETTGVGKDDVPIEVGIIVTDSDWNKLDNYESLIHSPESNAFTLEKWDNAKRFHGIPKSWVTKGGVNPKLVSNNIVDLAKKWRPVNGRLILLSDNIQFEWRHTQWLLNHIGYDVTDVFHYCGWDTSLLSMFTSFKDPTNTNHRALSDVKGLLNELRRVAEEVTPYRLPGRWKPIMGL